jgi:hypothetical protein
VTNVLNLIKEANHLNDIFQKHPKITTHSNQGFQIFLNQNEDGEINKLVAEYADWMLRDKKFKTSSDEDQENKILEIS